MSLLIEIIKSVLFGIVQGITEWLPISSTGHLILLNTIMPLRVFQDAASNEAFWNMYKVVIQFGSILAVLVLYFRRLNPWDKAKDEKKKKQTIQLWVKVIIATIPAGIAGVLLDDLIDAKLSTPTVIAIALIVYGILFIWIENRSRKPKIHSIDAMDYGTAAKIGCFQALALIPGTSRSGSTILGSVLMGCSRGTATEFSFFMAIPVMFGASLLKLVKMAGEGVSMGVSGMVVLLVGMIVSFVVSVIVIRSFLKYIRKHDFKIFGLYRIILGVIILVLGLMGVLPAGVSA